MSFHVKEDVDAVTVFLDGEIDLDRSPEARKLLLDGLRAGKPLRVDLAEVEYMDSSGIASLVETYQRAREKNLDFTLIRVSEPVLKVLKLARLDQVFSIRSTP